MKRRLRRRNFILAVFNLSKTFWAWVCRTVTFKKCIVVYCLSFIYFFVEYLKWCYANGIYFDTTVATTLITAHVAELGLTALNSLDILKRKDRNVEDENYG